MKQERRDAIVKDIFRRILVREPPKTKEELETFLDELTDAFCHAVNVVRHRKGN